MTPLLRPTWLEVDLDAAVENVRTVRRLIGPRRKLFAVVKANGYGFGSRAMGQAFAEAGADALGVADLADGVRLRRAGLSLPILVFPNALPEAAAEVVAARLTPALTDLDAAQAYSAAASESQRAGASRAVAGHGSAPERYPVFVKVDVGLERLGVPAEHAVKVIQAIAALPGLALEGVCTHLHLTSHGDPAYIAWQFGRFTAVLDALRAAGVDVPVRLAASSPLVAGHPETYLNAVDPGSMLYGLARPGFGEDLVLRPVFRALKARVIELKDLSPRERFASAAPFPITAPMRLGVIPIGAGDGVHRLHVGRALIRGRSVPILVRPSLEHTRLDLTGVPDARVGDEVVLIGRQGDEAIPPEEVAARHGVEPVHVATTVGDRVARVYVRGGEAAHATGAER
jgi:alanine racemase